MPSPTPRPATPATLKLLRWRAGDPARRPRSSITLQHHGRLHGHRALQLSEVEPDPRAKASTTSSATRIRAATRFGAMALLAADDPAHPDHAARRARLQAEAHALIPIAATVAAQMMSDERDTAGMITWQRGHTLIFLAEYYLVTGDAAGPARHRGLRGQHRQEPEPLRHGRATSTPTRTPTAATTARWAGSTAWSTPTGMPCFLGLLLARECGLTNPEIDPAIERTSRFFAYYCRPGRGPLRRARGLLAGPREQRQERTRRPVLHARRPNRVEEGKFFAKMCHRLRQRAGNGTHRVVLQLPVGAAGRGCGGEEAAAAHFSRISWMLDLHRRWDGGFDYDTLNGEGPNSGSQYNNFRMSTAALLTYALPLRRLHLTGRGHDNSRWLDSSRCGRGDHRRRLRRRIRAPPANSSPTSAAGRRRCSGKPPRNSAPAASTPPPSPR